MKFAAAIAFGLYILYGIAFVAAGLKPQGDAGVKVIGWATELAMVVAFVWVLQS